MVDPPRIADVLGRLKALGVKLTIDDFGSGYTSLAYLKTLPIDSVKIDRKFVSEMTTDEGDAAIVRSIVDIGRNLGLDVIAEGVESVECWNRLRMFGCSLIQGYLVGRPAPASELEETLVPRLRIGTLERLRARGVERIEPFPAQAVS